MDDLSLSTSEAYKVGAKGAVVELHGRKPGCWSLLPGRGRGKPSGGSQPSAPVSIGSIFTPDKILLSLSLFSSLNAD